jgi:hypothetical protein
VGQLAGLLGSMLGALAESRVVGAMGPVAAAEGMLIASLIVIAWLGLGDLILRLHSRDHASRICSSGHDVLFDYARSPIVDDRLPREHNLARLRLLLDFFQNGTRLIRGDRKFWLIELPPSSGAIRDGPVPGTGQ